MQRRKPSFFIGFIVLCNSKEQKSQVRSMYLTFFLKALFAFAKKNQEYVGIE